MVVVAADRDYINRMLQGISGMKVLILDSEMMDYKRVTVAETISRFWRRNGKPPNGVHLSDHKLPGEAMDDVGPYYAVNSASLRQTTNKVMASHLRITIAFTVQSMPSARSEKGVYDAARKSSMAFNIPFCGRFLEELEVFYFF